MAARQPTDYTARYQDCIGQPWGTLVIMAYVGPERGHQLFEVCCLNCGSERVMRLNNLRSRTDGGCGCMRTESHAIHRQSKSVEFTTWQGMKSRCCNPFNRAYHNYGGRGIQVCQRWLDSFENFLADMGERPSPQHSLDRIDNDGNYEPGNVRWATKREQTANKRSSRLITVGGETLMISEWAERTGIRRATLWQRIVLQGWDPEVAVLTPARKMTYR